MCRGPGAHHWMPLSCLEQLQGQHGKTLGVSYDTGLPPDLHARELLIWLLLHNSITYPQVAFVGQVLPVLSIAVTLLNCISEIRHG